MYILSASFPCTSSRFRKLLPLAIVLQALQILADYIGHAARKEKVGGY
jgi:hypothetical protein